MKRSILGLLYLIQGMRHVGVDIDRRLADIGISADALDPNSLIHRDLELNIQRKIADGIRPELGLEVGKHYALAGYGPMLMLLVSCKTVVEAIQYGVQFQYLTHLSGKLFFEVEQEFAVLSYAPDLIQNESDLFRAHCEISGTVKFVCDIYKMVGLEFKNIKIDLPFSRPTDLKELEQFQHYYGEHINFDQDRLRLYFDLEIFNLTLPSADPIAFAGYLQRCTADYEKLEVVEDRDPLLQSIEDFLNLQMHCIPTMQDTAKALNIPERTLRYRLSQSGVSFKTIREEMIRHKSMFLLKQANHSIDEISTLLGYSEPAAFNHAFKRWYGISPRAFRNQSIQAEL